MIKNYLKIAWRNLLKERQFTLLNLIGLSTGLACTLLIYLWVNDELHVDKYNEKDDRMYQIMANHKSEDGIKTIQHTAGPLATSLAAEFPEVENAVTVLPASWFSDKGTVTFNDTHLKAGGQFVGRDYFNVFSCPVIDGDAKSLFRDNQTVGISYALALKLFHTTDNIIGKTIKWEHGEFGGMYNIGLIFKENPANATEHFDLLFNFDLYVAKREGMKSWSNSDPNTYVILRQEADSEGFNTKIKAFLTTKDKGTDITLLAVKFSDKYLHGHFENGVQAGGRITYVRLFSIIALFILIIACINFMNLSTAKASGRMKEVGIKKAIGAKRGSLVAQYLGESVMMAFLALFVAIALVFLLLPQFNQVTGKNIILDFDIKMVASALVITLVTGLIAGSYPAFYLSGFNTISVLKGAFKTSVSELWLRKGLVVFQFTISVIFIVSVLVVYRQIKFIQAKNLGYSRDNIIHFEIPMSMDSASLKRSEAFVGQLKELPGVKNVSSYYHDLTGSHGAISDMQWPGKQPGKNVDFANLEVGYNFIETAGMQLKEGRSFSQNSNSQKEIVFNEAAIKSMGLKDPVGKTVKFWDQKRQIVGVVKDFNFESLYEKVKPCFFQTYPVMPNIMVKMQAGTETQTIARVKQTFADFHKGNVFEYQFLDENYNALYASEQRIGILSQYFAGLAILISCLGLFGLAAFTAQRRQKEIGIRKVVGATIQDVTMLLSVDFLKLVMIAMIIAFPLIGWAMNRWLQGFAYHAEIGINVFLISAVSICTLALVTVGYQAIKAAVMDPVKSLKSE
ncbi:ABC transporter permease [Dyadobacter psychrophilus]|uniref:Duplicated orphan permease n=1 Tax=Dyadobacter psychrophilus TaxID=651661 RepID=A0A1T5CAZ3_9BACT|nr:ABC transporter permease [Dyadobacter psychrophilus]SKB56617.1 duplicated orphan permease [Dyadobacter psychrophilus]